MVTGQNNFVASKNKNNMMLNSKSIGNKIAIARKKINLSQAELAQQVSISSQAVGKWERGESMPDITTLNRLAEILGVDLNYFSKSFQTVDAVKAALEKSCNNLVEFSNTQRHGQVADVVYAPDIFHMINSPAELLKELSRIAKPGSKIIIEDGHQPRENTIRKIEQSGILIISGQNKLYVVVKQKNRLYRYCDVKKKLCASMQDTCCKNH